MVSDASVRVPHTRVRECLATQVSGRCRGAFLRSRRRFRSWLSDSSGFVGRDQAAIVDRSEPDSDEVPADADQTVVGNRASKIDDLLIGQCQADAHGNFLGEALLGQEAQAGAGDISCDSTDGANGRSIEGNEVDGASDTNTVAIVGTGRCPVGAGSSHGVQVGEEVLQLLSIHRGLPGPRNRIRLPGRASVRRGVGPRGDVREPAVTGTSL